jgi:hypothetical protein
MTLLHVWNKFNKQGIGNMGMDYLATLLDLLDSEVGGTVLQRNVGSYFHSDDNLLDRRLGGARHFIRVEGKRVPRKVLNGIFLNARPVGKPRERCEDVVITDLRNTGMEETSRRQRRKGASCEGAQDPEVAVAP